MTRILIIDDRPDNLYMLRALLQGYGYSVDEAANGAEGLAQARKHPPDLIISDLLMPVLDGFSLLRQWRADPALAGIPFIVFTATYTSAGDERLAMALGADEFLLKPSEPDAIIACVKGVVAKGRAGILPSAGARPDEEQVLLREYNEVLLRKLEAKILEVERINEEFRHELAERRRVQEELRESEGRFRATFEQVALGIAHVSPEGRYLWVNESLCRMTGYSSSEFFGMSYDDIIHPDWLEQTYAARRSLLNGDCASHAAEKCYMRKSGESFWGSRVTTLVRHEDGTPRYFISVIADVTARKQAEASLRQRDRAIQALALGIVITDPGRPDNPITYASQGFERMTGYTEAEILGRNCRFLQGPDTDQDQLAKLREAMAASRPIEVELLNYRKDGTSFWNSLTVTPVFDEDGATPYFVGVQTDVSERRLLEAELLQARKMEAVGRLAGGVAHDFNNHLTVIGGYSEEVLSVEGLPPEIREPVSAIAQAGARAAALTRQLLDFSRQAVMQPRVIDLNLAVRDISALLRRLIGEDVSLVLTLAAGVGAVKVDPAQFDQVIMNLATNARDAMPQGGTLILETAQVQFDEGDEKTHHGCPPGPYVMLAVTDSGSGMSPEISERIFEPFFTTKEVGRGTGLGLSTVFGIVQQSHGCIHAYSEPGHGSCFKIYLPQVGIQPGPDPSADPPVLRTGEETILLVEDDDDVRHLGQRALRARGYHVLTANDGQQALDLVEAHQGSIDLVLTDIVMPNLGGPELVARLRRRNPKLRAMFMSGYTNDAVVRGGLLDANVAFIQKPFTPRTLAARVREVLETAAGDAMEPPAAILS